MSENDPMTPADQLLFEQLRSGDERAAGLLVDRYFDDVYRFLRHLTRHVQDGEDLAQQTFLRAVRGVTKFDGRSGLRTWLHRIAYREFLNWHRSRRLFVALDPRRAVFDRELDAFVEREWLLEAIGKLSPKLRATFLLVEVQEMPQPEAAEILEVPVGTIKSRLSEARARLSRELTLDLEVTHVSEAL